MPMTKPRAMAMIPTDRAMTPLSHQLGVDVVLRGIILAVYICVEIEFNCWTTTVLINTLDGGARDKASPAALLCIIRFTNVLYVS